MPAPRLTPEQSAAIQKKIVEAAETSAEGLNWLAVSLRRVGQRTALMLAGVVALGGIMGLLSLRLLFTGQVLGGLLTGLFAVGLVGLAFFLLRQEAATLDVLDEGISSRDEETASATKKALDSRE
jgi:hypothetical protein